MAKHKVNLGGTGSNDLRDSTRPNTVNMQESDLRALFDELDEQAAGSKRRDYVRWPFREESVLLRIRQGKDGGSEATLKVACRNLSCGGMSVVHNAYVHSGSKVTVALPLPQEEYEIVNGTVSRCTHVRGTIHEVGIKFDKPITARDFVEADPFSDCFSLENVDPQDLKGRVLYIDSSPMNQRLVQHYLRGTELRFRSATEKGEGLAMAEEGCDLILVDYDLEGSSGIEVIKAIRDALISTPIILVTSDTSSILRQQLKQVDANAFLKKPIDQSILLRAIAEFMMFGTSTGTMSSTLPKDHPNGSLVEAYVEEVRGFALRLEKAIEKDDAMAARSICLQIAGTAPSLGFGSLGQVAEDAAKILVSSMSIEESIKPIQGLIAACRRVKR
ncbi:MAG: response regulator [Phycisphaerales bacterium]|nr:response regulator [Phycisphaerales bacterium]